MKRLSLFLALSLACTVGAFPTPTNPDPPEKVHHRYVGRSPDWKVVPG